MLAARRAPFLEGQGEELPSETIADPRQCRNREKPPGVCSVVWDAENREKQPLARIFLFRTARLTLGLARPPPSHSSSTLGECGDDMGLPLSTSHSLTAVTPPCAEVQSSCLVSEAWRVPFLPLAPLTGAASTPIQHLPWEAEAPGQRGQVKKDWDYGRWACCDHKGTCCSERRRPHSNSKLGIGHSGILAMKEAVPNTVNFEALLPKNSRYLDQQGQVQGQGSSPTQKFVLISSKDKMGSSRGASNGCVGWLCITSTRKEGWEEPCVPSARQTDILGDQGKRQKKRSPRVPEVSTWLHACQGVHLLGGSLTTHTSEDTVLS